MQKNHHRSIHSGMINSNLSLNAVPFRIRDVLAEGNTNCTAGHKKDLKLITGLCPVQIAKVMGSGGMLIEIPAMIDSRSNTSLLSKNAVERLGITGTASHVIMNLTGKKKRSETAHWCLEYRRGYQKDPGSIHYKETNGIRNEC